MLESQHSDADSGLTTGSATTNITLEQPDGPDPHGATQLLQTHSNSMASFAPDADQAITFRAAAAGDPPPTFNVADYGATADDDTDDSAAINAAIEAAHDAGGGTVVLGAGTYIVSGNVADKSDGAVRLLSNVSLQGDGIGSTVLKVADSWAGSITGVVRTPFDEVTTNASVSDLTIDGNRDRPNGGKIDGFYCGVKPGSPEQDVDITVSRVEIKDCSGYGFDPHEQTLRLTIEDCVSHGNGLDGFVADYIVDGVYRNNIAYDNDRHGFNITTTTTNLLLQDNIAYGNGFGSSGGAGIAVQRGTEDIPVPNGINIVGGEYYGNGREGILLKLADAVTISGADIHDNLRQGIRVEGATNTVIENNTIHNNSQELNAGYDEINIRLNSDATTLNTYYSTGTEVHNNTIYADGAIKARYGIREEATNSTADHPSGTVVGDNDITGMNTGDVSLPVFQPSPTEGDDFLAGTAGADNLAGLGGNDTYVFNHSGDVITEQPNGGTDTVVASISHTLAANAENLGLTGTALNGTGNELDNILTGNELANSLKGLAGADTLDGGAGADNMQGGDGNDTYYVDNSADVIVEKFNGGLGGTADLVFSSVTYVLSDQVEKLTLTGSDDINATGNSSINVLTGNDGDNVLDGQGGADSMIGGDGDDTYYVNHSGDVITEIASQGTDTVYATLTYSLAIGVSLEKLVLLGATAIDGNGNELANIIVGNDGANKIHGGGGADTIEGGLGADQLYGDAGNDLFVLRKGQFAGEVLEDFTGNGAAAGDRILFTGFSNAATLISLGAGSYKIVDGGFEETFRIKTPPGQVAFNSLDYSFEGQVINQEPTAATLGNSASGTEETVLNGHVPAGSDPEGENPLSYALVGSVAGLVFRTNGSFTYTPPTNVYGDVVFQYKVYDTGLAESAPQSFTITLAPTSDAPVITAEVAGTLVDTAAADTFANLTGQIDGSDPDGDSLTYGLAAGEDGISAYGVLTVNADGTYSFAANAAAINALNAGSNPVLTFQVQVSDGIEPAQVTTLTVNITGANDTSASVYTNATLANLVTTYTGAFAGALAGATTGQAIVVNTPAAFGDVGVQNVTANNLTIVAAQPFAADLHLSGAALNITLQGAAAIDVTANAAGGGLITGNDASNTLTGQGGADKLNGGGGADAMVGGAGDDTYYIDNVGDTVVEFGGQGVSDWVAAGISYTLAAGVQVEKFSTTSSGATTPIDLTGNAFAQALTGNAGSNRLNGAGGADTMTGLGGNDTYYIDNAGDKVVEGAGQGTSDWVATSVSYTLGAGVQVEIFSTTGSGATTAIDLTGNEFAQSITGNAGANIINGKAGADTMKGLAGNDTYFVDNVGDVVIEGAGGGTSDWVATSISYTLAAGVQAEKLSTTSNGATTAIDLTGNEFAQSITGNAGDNRLNGMGGADTMTGLAGNDTYYIDNVGDKVVEGANQGTSDWVATSVSYTLGAGVQVEKLSTTSSGATTAISLTGNEFGQAITGNAGANTISGKAGNDTLTGAGGADIFVFDTALNASTNVDTITDFNVAADTIQLENGIFTQIAGIGTLTADQFVKNTSGLATDANDRIIYETDTGKLFYDSNGSADGGVFQFATLAHNLSLTNLDFVVI